MDVETDKFVFGGLFCERIFGPTKNWECYCGRYDSIAKAKKLFRKASVAICSTCKVEITHSSIRNYRMG